MSLVAPIAAVLLGVSFVVAGASKLAARDSWPQQARGLGAPGWAIPLVPWVELVLGALLIVQIARQASAVGAIVLLMIFTLLIAMRLRKGEHPPCACFGAWSASPIGTGHLLRNAALMALGALALF